MNSNLDVIIACATIAESVNLFLMEEICSEEDDKDTKKRKLEEMETITNDIAFRLNSPPIFNLKEAYGLIELIKDPSRQYFQIFTSFCVWEFVFLADYLKSYINTSRNNSQHKSSCNIKRDHYHRLYYTLFWLCTNAEYRQMEFYFGWSKHVLQLDIIHVLLAIINGLDNFIVWPNAQERLTLSTVNTGILKGCVGIVDACEFPIDKSKNKEIERITYSGKARTNTKKLMGVIDMWGYFRFIVTDTNGSVNDREQFIGSLLCTKRCDYFSEGEYVIGDGIYRGDGPIKVAYDSSELSNDPDKTKSIFNSAFTEVRKKVECAFNRIKMWFPCIGNKTERWNHSTELLNLVLHAVCRLHNWKLQIRNLNYSPQSDPKALFSKYW